MTSCRVDRDHEAHPAAWYSRNSSTAYLPHSRPMPEVLNPPCGARWLTREPPLNPDPPGPHLAGYHPRPGLVGAPDRRGQAVGGVVGQRDRVGLVVKRDDHEVRKIWLGPAHPLMYPAGPSLPSIGATLTARDGLSRIAASLPWEECASSMITAYRWLPSPAPAILLST